MPEAPSPGHWCEVWPLLEALVGSPNIAVITTKHNHAPCLDSNFQYTTISPWAQTLQRRAFRPGFYRRTRTSRRSRTRPPALASSSWWRQSPPCSTRASPVWKNAGLHCYCICACFFQWSTTTSLAACLYFLALKSFGKGSVPHIIWKERFWFDDKEWWILMQSIRRGEPWTCFAETNHPLSHPSWIYVNQSKLCDHQYSL